MSDQIKSLLGITNRAGQVQIHNVLSPLLWLCAICMPLGVFGIVLGPSSVQWVFILLVLGPVALSAISYVFFAFNDPNRLQSESYRNEHARLELISKQHGQITDPDDLKPVSIDTIKPISGSVLDE